MSRAQEVAIASASVFVAVLLVGSIALGQSVGLQPVVLQQSLGAGFTYQGQLKQGGTPVNTTCDFQFSLWDAESAGGQVGSTQSVSSLSVSNGAFAALLNNWAQFGADPFTGQARWIEVAVRCPTGTGDFTSLSPRQALTAAPYALSLQPGANIKGLGEVLTVTATDPAGYPLYSRAIAGLSLAPSKTAYGVYGQAVSPDGIGVGGWATSSTGATKGVYGTSSSSDGAGVFGSGARGVYGESWSSATGAAGVYGLASAPSGVTHGVYGESSSPNGTGVAGRATGAGSTSTGVYGQSDSALGTGVYALAASGTGLFADGGRYGLYSVTNSADGWAGYFTSSGNGVYISANAGKTGLSVASGTKNAVVPTADGSRLLYSEEASEVWFTDYGFGRLADGRAVIPIDPTFGQTVNLHVPYHVFVQVYGKAEVYVTERTPSHFKVQLSSGDPGVEFSYRIVAKRLGYEGERLERAPWADGDANLYPGQTHILSGLPQQELGLSTSVSHASGTSIPGSAGR